jgi:DNA-binding transcriptional regulator YdaS (Cro superfamily)
MRSSLVLQLLVLRKALSVCGTEEALARRLDVSSVALQGWLAGQEAVPLAVFNRAMILVNRAYREETSRGQSTLH